MNIHQDDEWKLHVLLKNNPVLLTCMRISSYIDYFSFSDSSFGLHPAPETGSGIFGVQTGAVLPVPRIGEGSFGCELQYPAWLPLPCGHQEYILLFFGKPFHQEDAKVVWYEVRNTL